MDRWKTGFMAKLPETINFVMILGNQRKIFTFPQIRRLQRVNKHAKDVSAHHQNMEETKLSVSQSGNNIEYVKSQAEIDSSSKYFKAFCEPLNNFSTAEQARYPTSRSISIAPVLDTVVIYSAKSNGDGRVTLKIVGGWTKAKGLQLIEKIASPPITNFHRRKMILTAVHVRQIII